MSKWKDKELEKYSKSGITDSETIKDLLAGEAFAKLCLGMEYLEQNYADEDIHDIMTSVSFRDLNELYKSIT